jgi:hypothetical protein
MTRVVAIEMVGSALRAIPGARKFGFDMKKVNAMQRGANVVFADPLN